MKPRAGGRLPGTLPQVGEAVPIHRAAQPVEIAPVYVALASSAAATASHKSFFQLD
jgi:hypothetical protein